MAAMKIGLALGGGAARGWAHIGVIEALRAAGIVPHVIAGTSIGAVVGGCHAAGRLEEVTAFARELTRRKVFGFLDFNLSGSGLISGQRLCDRLEDHLGDQAIETLDLPFTAVATEIGTGHEVWLSRGRLVDAMRASYAIPGIFRPVRIGSSWLFDGALVNPIPVAVCRAMGARYVIAVNLNADMCSRGSVLPQVVHGTVEDMSLADQTDQLEVAPTQKRGAKKLLQRQFFGRGDDSPGISRVMIEAFNIVQDRIARSRLAGDPPDAIIAPRLSGVGLFDFHKAGDLIRLGEIAARRALDDIRHELDNRMRHDVWLPVPARV